MARIPDEVMERLKREVSLARLMEAPGQICDSFAGGSKLRRAMPGRFTRQKAYVLYAPRSGAWLRGSYSSSSPLASETPLSARMNAQ